MAGKPKRMSQIKQLIRLHQQGLGKKTIARQLGMSKKRRKFKKKDVILSCYLFFEPFSARGVNITETGISITEISTSLHSFIILGFSGSLCELQMCAMCE
jgi:hypothetical protein